MWTIILTMLFYTTTQSKRLHSQFDIKSDSIFNEDQIIFSSNFNITRILVPTDGRYIQTNDIPSIFFTVSDPKLEGGSCIYVLQGLAPYELLEGGRDSTADYGDGNGIYFGASDGLYKYNHETISAKRYGAFRDNILQLQKANGSDAIYILTADYKIYVIEKNGTVKSRVSSIICALEFVLDTSNNIYYIHCIDKGLHIVYANGDVPCITASVVDDFREIKLIRPAFIMEKCVPFFGDGRLYLLFSNGTSEKKDLVLKEQPSAFSVDATLYLVVAIDGNIYEFNVMDVILRSLFGVFDEWPKDVTRIVTYIMETARDGIDSIYKNHKRDVEDYGILQ